MSQTTNVLAPGTLLQGETYRYRIDGVLGSGSFGVTYLATGFVKVAGPLGEIETEARVAIKEFFMQEVSSRDATGSVSESSDSGLVHKYAQKFRTEARNLSRMSHPNIVKVLDFIDANNTYYYVMEHIDGTSLDEYVCSRRGLPEAEAVACIRAIGNALAYMHDCRMLHLDLKPKNVMRRTSDGTLLLIDFGLSKQYDESGEPESSTAVGLGTPGYAPLEQANDHNSRDFSPTLDVYALGATLFKMLTAHTPPKSSDVLNDGLPLHLLQERGVSQKVIEAVQKAMEPRRKDRVPTVRDFLALLGAEEASAVVEQKHSPKTAAVVKHDRRSPRDEENTAVKRAAAPLADESTRLQRPAKESVKPAPTASAAKPVAFGAKGKGGNKKLWGIVGGAAVVIALVVALLVGGKGENEQVQPVSPSTPQISQQDKLQHEQWMQEAETLYRKGDSLLRELKGKPDDATAFTLYDAVMLSRKADSLATAVGIVSAKPSFNVDSLAKSLCIYFDDSYKMLESMPDDPMYTEDMNRYKACLSTLQQP